MTALTILVFLPPILTGALLTHLLWPDRQLGSLVLKAFLGAGIGLGLWSLLYFLFLLVFAGKGWFIVVELAFLLALCAAVILQERKRGSGAASHVTAPRPTRFQLMLLGLGCIVFLVSLVSTASYLLRRRQGDWDAWMMYNRAARFVYRDQANWLQSFSPQMDPLFHADYPLLLAMNIASGWETLGTDTPHVPMVQSAFFAVACLGLLVTALASAKSLGQASVGLLLLWGTPVFVNEGAREMADIPLAFFILATAILFYLFAVHKKPGLMVLAGLSAGLAAWTKNEGSVLVIGTILGAILGFRKARPARSLLWVAAGLALPLAIVLYFKLALAPPSDVLSGGPARSLQDVLTLSRHLEILLSSSQEVVSFGSWGIPFLPVGIIPILLVLYILFRSRIPGSQRPAYVASCTMLGVQALGYYGIYLITPYELAWHLSYSITRVFLQIYPLLLFLALSASLPVESALESITAGAHGVEHAASN